MGNMPVKAASFAQASSRIPGTFSRPASKPSPVAFLRSLRAYGGPVRLGIRRGRLAGPQVDLNLHPAHGFRNRHGRTGQRDLLRRRAGGGLAGQPVQRSLALLLADDRLRHLRDGRFTLGGRHTG